jgi:hypothetical protein
MRADDYSDDLFACERNFMRHEMDQLPRVCPMRGMPTQSITKQSGIAREQQE